MKTIHFKGRNVLNVAHLQKHLRENGYSSAHVVQQGPPHVILNVILADAEGDPIDLVNAYRDPAQLTVTCESPVGPGGIPECPADGQSGHTIHIVKRDAKGNRSDGGETLRIFSSQMISIQPSDRELVDGQLTLRIGPSMLVGDVTLRIHDRNDKVLPASIRLRFV